MLEEILPFGFNSAIINAPFFLASSQILFLLSFFYNYIITISLGINVFGLHLIISKTILILTFLSFSKADSVHAQGYGRNGEKAALKLIQSLATEAVRSLQTQVPSQAHTMFNHIMNGNMLFPFVIIGFQRFKLQSFFLSNGFNNDRSGSEFQVKRLHFLFLYPSSMPTLFCEIQGIATWTV